MKRTLFLLLLSCLSQLASAQVGIGNTTPKAQLDITASNALTPTAEDGILIPRIDNFPAINPTAPQNGMLVFLTTTSGLNLPGFYYWSNPTTTWVGISNANKSWDTTGNSVAVSGTHFIGTTTAQDVDFRTNNIIRMRLSQKGQLEFVNTGRSVFLGEQAGENDDLTNNFNVFIGYKSGFENISGFSNSAVGYQSLSANTLGFNNSGLGYNSLLNNTAGNSNTAIGTNTLYSNTIGGSNTALGTNSLYSNLTGGANTAAGVNAMRNNISGSNNTAIGNAALNTNSTGYANIAVGGSTLLSNTIGYHNTAVGFAALRDNVDGIRNTAVGTSAMYYNTTGSNNTSLGLAALRNNISGNNNTATGTYSLSNNSLGSGNTAFGRGALQTNDIGSNNVASGMSALSSNAAGNFNTATGHTALANNTSGNNNVAIGFGALTSNVSGSNNTGIGNGANISAAPINNSTAIGNLATVNVSNKVRFGNAATTIVEGQVSFSNPSDARFKNNIKSNVPGLDFIMKLKPVTYNFDTKKFDQHLMQNMPDSIRSKNLGLQDYSKSTTIRHSGFLAQDIEKAANEIGYDFDGLYVPDPTNPTDNYSVAYSQFIMPMVKSIQEQQHTITSQKDTIDRLHSENVSLKIELEKQRQLLNAIDQRLDKLEKN